MVKSFTLLLFHLCFFPHHIISSLEQKLLVIVLVHNINTVESVIRENTRADRRCWHCGDNHDTWSSQPWCCSEISNWICSELKHQTVNLTAAADWTVLKDFRRILKELLSTYSFGWLFIFNICCIIAGNMEDALISNCVFQRQSVFLRGNIHLPKEGFYHLCWTPWDESSEESEQDFLLL